MSNIDSRSQFLTTSAEWICDLYTLEICYFAKRINGVIRIINASIHATPIKLSTKNNFHIDIENIFSGYYVVLNVQKNDALKIFADASDGVLKIKEEKLVLEKGYGITHASEFPTNDTYDEELNLVVKSSTVLLVDKQELIKEDSALRCNSIPFNGVSDLCNYLRLTDYRKPNQQTSIKLVVSPPVDIEFKNSELNVNKYTLNLLAHANFDITKLILAINEYPSNTITSKKQVSNLVVWENNSENNVRKGKLELNSNNAISILAMLSVSNKTVRRHWLNDPTRSVNTRYVSTQHFDKEMKLLRHSLLESTESRKFEKAVASLLYLLGFSSALQIENESPDIIVSTLGGKLAIVECTTRIADFNSKIGKLVDRRNSLLNALVTSNHKLDVAAFLVCNSNKSQIAIDENTLSHHQITLLTKEDIERGLLKIQTHNDADAMLERFSKKLEQQQSQ